MLSIKKIEFLETDVSLWKMHLLFAASANGGM